MYLGEWFVTHEEGYLEFPSPNVSKILTEFHTEYIQQMSVIIENSNNVYYNGKNSN